MENKIYIASRFLTQKITGTQRYIEVLDTRIWLKEI